MTRYHWIAIAVTLGLCALLAGMAESDRREIEARRAETQRKQQHEDAGMREAWDLRTRMNAGHGERR